MSEYQYYEFQALDRPLTKEQISGLRAYSSRARINPSSFVNVYNWGDFKVTSVSADDLHRGTSAIPEVRKLSEQDS